MRDDIIIDPCLDISRPVKQGSILYQVTDQDHFENAADQDHDHEAADEQPVSFAVQQFRDQQIITQVDQEGQVCSFDEGYGPGAAGWTVILVAQVIPDKGHQHPEEKVMKPEFFDDPVQLHIAI